MGTSSMYFCENFYSTIHKTVIQVTKLGEYLTKRSVNKAIVARKTGLSKQRMGELTLNEDAKLRAREVYLIALAIEVSPCELFEYVCSDLKLIE
jgi:DNA-binding Xre family transcriptional regulator